MSAENILLVAIHEAGHAVAHCRFNFECGDVTILPDGEAGTEGSAKGECRTFIDTDGIVMVAEENVIVLLAGHSAVVRKWPELARTDCGQGTDEAQAEHIVGCDRISALRKRTDRFVAENWRCIEAVAELLVERKTLSAEEVDDVMTAVDEGIDWRQWIRMSYAERRKALSIERMHIPPIEEARR